MKLNNQKGISLVEIIAAMAIIGIVAVVFSTAIGVMMRHEQYAKQLQHNTQIGQTIMENLANETNIPTGSETTYAGVSELAFAENSLEIQGAFEGETVQLHFKKEQQLVEQADLKITVQKELNGDISVKLDDYQNQQRTEKVTANRLEISYEKSNNGSQIVIKPHAGGVNSISYSVTEQWPTVILDFEAQLPIFISSPTDLLKVQTKNYQISEEAAIKTMGTVQLQTKDVVEQMGALYTVEIDVASGTPYEFSTVKQMILQGNEV